MSDHFLLTFDMLCEESYEFISPRTTHQVRACFDYIAQRFSQDFVFRWIYLYRGVPFVLFAYVSLRYS
jgi:hypothetical protein